MELSHLASLEEAAAVERAARENHYAEKAAPDSFWRRAAASLPPHARRRHFHLFEAAERWDPVLELIVDACRGTETPRRRSAVSTWKRQGNLV